MQSTRIHAKASGNAREQSASGNESEPSLGNSNAASTTLVVDLDGTLTPADTLIESILQLLKQQPLAVLRLPLLLLQGRAAFKQFVAARSALSVEHLPYRAPLVDYLRAEHVKGRRIVLATAADHAIADAVATQLGVFDEVLASDGVTNLKGLTKLEAIHRSTGDGFVYAGDSRADLPIWKAAQAAILVGASFSVAKAVRRNTRIEREFPRQRVVLLTWMNALRVHQWLKNLLLFVPLLTAFAFLAWDKLTTTIVAFFAFSLAASATYLMNDLRDLEDDRAHPKKRHRPLASAEVPILSAVAMAAVALLVALGLAATVSQRFLLVLLFYLALTSSYTWTLKQYVLIDVLLLSLLYTLRIVAGAVATDITVSQWLLAFSVFVFLSLALVKRCSELVFLGQMGAVSTRGRDYRVADLAVLWPLGVGSAMCAVVVFGLFISSPQTQLHYSSPQLLWLAALGLIYWLARLWIKTIRGEMHHDPLVFAVRDFGSRMSVIAMICATLAAHYVSLR